MQLGAVIFALALATPLSAQTVILRLVPNTNPDAVIHCAIRQDNRQIHAIATKGLGFQNLRPFSWWSNSAEDEALLHSLSAFLAGDLPSANLKGLPILKPPYTTVDWIARANGGLASGHFQMVGTMLPAPLRDLIATVMPGSYCADAQG
ncbi:MAG: hypothetical protein ABIQ85_08980 [Cypionkella sp.]